MLKQWYAVAFLAIFLAAAPAFGGTALYDWRVNVNGTVYSPPPVDPGDPSLGLQVYTGPAAGSMPIGFDFSAFDWSTGLGSIIFDYTPPAPGDFSLVWFFDHEIDNEINSAYNEYGTDPVIAPPAGQRWEIDEPGWNSDPAYPMGDIYWHAIDSASALDNSLGVTNQFPYNVSMALGFNVNIPVGQRAIFRINLQTQAPTGAFALEQHDDASSDVIYLFGNVDMADIPSNGDVPEPASFALIGIGLVGVAAVRLRKRA